MNIKRGGIGSDRMWIISCVSCRPAAVCSFSRSSSSSTFTPISHTWPLSSVLNWRSGEKKRTAHRGRKKKRKWSITENWTLYPTLVCGAMKNRYLLSYCKGVEKKKKPESFLYGFYLIYFCACVCLHSAAIRVLTHTERVKRVLESFTWKYFFILKYFKNKLNMWKKKWVAKIEFSYADVLCFRLLTF